MTTTREQRGLAIAALCKIGWKNGAYIVPSQSDASKEYAVDVDHETCTCPDHKETGFKCKHLYAAEFTTKREVGGDGTITETKTMTFTEKRVYTQDWPNYSLAQREEKRRFQVLLHDLCRNIWLSGQRIFDGCTQLRRIQPILQRWSFIFLASKDSATQNRQGFSRRHAKEVSESWHSSPSARFATSRCRRS